MITIDDIEFLEYSGINLSIELVDLDDGGNKVERTIKLWTRRVYDQINVRIETHLDLSPTQIETIKEAICEYGMYYLKNGDIFRASGYHEDKGLIVPQQEMEKIKFPEHIIDMLRRSGLIRRGLSVRRKYNQTRDNFYNW